MLENIRKMKKITDKLGYFLATNCGDILENLETRYFLFPHSRNGNFEPYKLLISTVMKLY